MRSKLGVAIAAGILVLALSGCGGSASHYSLDSACLDAISDGTVEKTDIGATVSFASSLDTVTFEVYEEAGQAKDEENAFRLMGEGMGIETNDIVSRKGNIVVAWNQTPSSSERSAAEKCVSAD